MFKSNKTYLVIITLLAIIFGWQLLRSGYFSSHDNLHIMRLYEMNKCFDNGQIPCRWSPDMGGGYGQPTFNYYSATPYYLGELFHQLGFSFADSTKLLFLLSIILTGIFSYLLFAEFASPLGSFIGAILLTFVPYRAVDIFVRGALAEVFSLSLIPLVMYAILRTIKRPSLRHMITISVSLSLFLCSHNITSDTSLFVLVPFTLTTLYVYKPTQKSLILLLSGSLLGLGLSSFFILPVLLERNLIQTTSLTQGYFDYNVHFVSLKQLFLPLVWGYGPSEPGTHDNISFAVGLIQSLSLFLFPIVFLLKKQGSKLMKLGLTFWFISIATLFMTHNQSSVVWRFLPILSFAQFPWRFLGVVVIGLSATWVIIYENFSSYRKLIAAILVISTIILNFGYFKFESHFPNQSDSTLLSGENFSQMQLSAVSDYLPISSKEVPNKVSESAPWSTNQGVDISNFQKRSNYFSADIDVYTTSADVIFPVTYFPGWIVYNNNGPDPISITTDNNYGLISVSLPKGHHKVQAFFENTPIRQLSNTISFVSLLLLLVVFIVSKESNEKK